MNKAVRYLTLLAGWSLMLWVIIANYDGIENLFFQLAIFILWVLIPYYLYFFVSRNEERLPWLLLPSLALNALYLLAVYDYFTFEDSTSALVFIVLPIAGIAVMALVYLVLWGVVKMFNLLLRSGLCQNHC